MRIEEIRGLDVRNVNFEKRYYSVQTKKERHDQEIQYQLKSKAAYREISLLFDHHIKLLKDYLEQDFNEFPFQNISYTWMREQKKKLEKLTGLKFRTYDLRHTFASMLIDMRSEDGKSAFTPKQIQVIMGHESITTTFNIYGHLMNRDYNTQITIANSYLDFKF